jgi:hypothetical protein
LTAILKGLYSRLDHLTTEADMENNHDDQAAMIARYRDAANRIGVASGVIKSHISHDEAAQSVAGDQYFLELISEAELRIGMQEISFECQTTLLNSCEKALADRDVKNDQLRAQGQRLKVALDEEAGKAYPDVHPFTRQVLAETPAQSLAEHDAALLEEQSVKYERLRAAAAFVEREMCDHGYGHKISVDALNVLQEALSND